MSNFPRATEFAKHVSVQQRAVLLAPNIDEVEAGIGTWMMLKHAGLVDDLFNLTELGREVRHILQTDAAKPEDHPHGR
jgi:hypothetical protein